MTRGEIMGIVKHFLNSKTIFTHIIVWKEGKSWSAQYCYAKPTILSRKGEVLIMESQRSHLNDKNIKKVLGDWFPNKKKEKK